VETRINHRTPCSTLTTLNVFMVARPPAVFIKVHVFAAPRTATASLVNQPKARLCLVRLALVVSRSDAGRRVEKRHQARPGLAA
jgi:hypothetical protein